jgi:flagellar basal-body rod modification protein FlgD
MPIPAVNNQAAATGATTGSSATGSSAKSSLGLSGQFNENTFLKLLVAQLRNQDPMQPTDNAQMMSQMAQFSMVDQLNTLNETSAYLAGAQGMMVGSSMLGKQVTAMPPDGTPIVGTVSQVALSGGEVILTVNGQDVPLSEVIKVSQSSATTTSAATTTDVQTSAAAETTQTQTTTAQTTQEDATG